jgi:hypothetical protein
VYALCDPHFAGDQAVYYIGLAFDPLTQRRRDHYAAARRGEEHPLYDWLRGLFSLGLLPEIVFLQQNATVEDEKHWIDHWRGRGAPLCNLT